MIFLNKMKSTPLNVVWVSTSHFPGITTFRGQFSHNYSDHDILVTVMYNTLYKGGGASFF